MSAQISRLSDNCEFAEGRVVVIVDIERVFAGVKTRFAGFNAAFVLKGIPNLILEISALPIAIKAFVCRDGFSSSN